MSDEKKPAYEVDNGEYRLLFRDKASAIKQAIADLEAEGDEEFALHGEGDELVVKVTMRMMTDAEIAARPEGL